MYALQAIEHDLRMFIIYILIQYLVNTVNQSCADWYCGIFVGSLDALHTRTLISVSCEIQPFVHCIVFLPLDCVDDDNKWI